MNALTQSQSLGLAISSLVLSILSIVIGPFGCIPGIICGHLARKKTDRDTKSPDRGIALAGLIVGYLFLFLIAVIFVLYSSYKIIQ
jgi:hypothetical protein